MKVRVTFDVDDHMRRAIASRRGETGPAARKDVAADIEAIVNATWEDYAYEYEQDEQFREEE